MKNIPYYDVRELHNLKQLVNDSCKIYKDRVAYYVKKGTPNYTTIKYGQVKQDIDALGTALINLGLKDKKIAVIGENRYEWAMSYLAVINGTGIVVPLDKQLPLREIENCVNRAKVSAIIYSDKVKDAIADIKEKCDFVEYFIGMDKQEDDGKYLSFDKLLEKGYELVKNGDKSFIDATIDENEMKELLFTSGTTSEAKAVMLSHKNICFNMYQQCRMLYIAPEDTFLSMLPLHHVYECTCGFLTPMYRGASVAYCEGLRHIQKNMQEAHISVFLSVPLVYETLYRKIWENIEKQGKGNLVRTMIKVTNFLDKIGIHIKRKVFKQIHDQLGGRARVFIAGAAAINPEVAKGFRELGILTVQGYGLTECAPIVSLNRDVDYKDDAAGLPLPSTEVKIVDVNSDGVGEIVVKGDHIMLGYYMNEKETNEAIKDGWFYTGDLGYIDSDGFIHITGRKKNVLITKNGKNVYPEELESLLNDNEYIKESLVYAKKTDDDVIIATDIMLDTDYIEEKFKDNPKTQEELKELIWQEIKKINSNLVGYKHIRTFNIREKEFEKTTTMKIKRYLEKKD